MIVGEVKEGPARFNPATRDPDVLRIALARFGCCGSEEAGELARTLLARGHVDAPSGHTLLSCLRGPFCNGNAIKLPKPPCGIVS